MKRRGFGLKRTFAVVILLQLEVIMGQNSLASEGWQHDRPANMPQIRNLEVMCAKEHMEVQLSFDKPFNGLVFSKGQFGHDGCVYVHPRSGQSNFRFSIRYNSCGTKPDMNGRFYENTVVVQYDEELIEVWDEAKRLRCEWYNDYEKTATKPPMVISELDVVELNFRGDNVDCWMEIQNGKGPWASPISGIVPLGSTMTMVVAINDHAGEFDMRVKSCEAFDGINRPVHLTDEHGCVLRPKMVSKFMKLRSNDGRSTVLTYAFFHAFKFPDSLQVQIRCKVEICRFGCPEHCEKAIPGSKQATYSIEAQATQNQVQSVAQQPPKHLLQPRQPPHQANYPPQQPLQPQQPQQQPRLPPQQPNYPPQQPQQPPKPPKQPGFPPQTPDFPSQGPNFLPQAPKVSQAPPKQQQQQQSPRPQQKPHQQQQQPPRPAAPQGRPQPQPQPPQYPQRRVTNQPAKVPFFARISGFNKPQEDVRRPQKIQNRKDRIPPALPQPEAQVLTVPLPLPGTETTAAPQEPETYAQARNIGSSTPIGESTVLPLITPELSAEFSSIADNVAVPVPTAATTTQSTSHPTYHSGPFPHGPRSLNFDKGYHIADIEKYVVGQDTSSRKKRYALLERHVRSADVGVQTGFEVISAVDLAFTPNATSEGVTVFKGRIREEVVYGICLPAAGFTVLFVLLSMSVVVSVLVATFICYHRQLQRTDKEAPAGAVPDAFRDWSMAYLARQNADSIEPEK